MKRKITVDDIYRVDRSAVERQLGHPIRTLSPCDCPSVSKLRSCECCKPTFVMSAINRKSRRAVATKAGTKG